jgi:hypothetical protein
MVAIIVAAKGEVPDRRRTAMLEARRVWNEALSGAFPPTRLQAPPPLYESA